MFFFRAAFDKFVTRTYLCLNKRHFYVEICGNKMPTRCNRGFYCRSYWHFICGGTMDEYSICTLSIEANGRLIWTQLCWIQFHVFP